MTESNKLKIRKIKSCIGKRFQFWCYRNIFTIDRNIFTIVGYFLNKNNNDIYIIASYTNMSFMSESEKQIRNRDIKLNGKIFLHAKKQNNYKIFSIYQLNNIIVE
jgi:hypothetical protein